MYLYENRLKLNSRIKRFYIIKRLESWMIFNISKIAIKKWYYFLLCQCLFIKYGPRICSTWPRNIRVVVTRDIERNERRRHGRYCFAEVSRSDKWLCSRFTVPRCTRMYERVREVGRSNGRRVIGSYAMDVIRFIIWRRNRGNISAGDNIMFNWKGIRTTKIFQLPT